MLDAFGKGASEDIQLAKSELYSQMTWDKDAKSSASAEPPVITPLPSPPPSPKPRKISLEETSEPPVLLLFVPESRAPDQALFVPEWRAPAQALFWSKLIQED